MSAQDAEVVRRLFEASARHDAAAIEHDVEELTDLGDQILGVVTTRSRGRASGLDVEWPHHAALWTIRDGRVVRVIWFASREDALASTAPP